LGDLQSAFLKDNRLKWGDTVVVVIIGHGSSEEVLERNPWDPRFSFLTSPGMAQG
jgi:hypothetical protein